MIEGQIGRAEEAAAVLAAIPVAEEDVATGERRPGLTGRGVLAQGDDAGEDSNSGGDCSCWGHNSDGRGGGDGGSSRGGRWTSVRRQRNRRVDDWKAGQYWILERDSDPLFLSSRTKSAEHALNSKFDNPAAALFCVLCSSAGFMSPRKMENRTQNERMIGTVIKKWDLSKNGT